MRCVLVIVSFMCFGQLIAQSTFYYSHITPYSNAPLSLAECERGYLITGENYLSGGQANGFLMLLDQQGTVLWEKIIPAPEPDKYESYRAAVYYNGYFYVTGFRWVDDKRRNLLLKIDPANGTVVLDKIIGSEPVLGRDNLILDMCVNEDGFLLAGSGFNVASTDGELIQIDLEGNILWSKFYDADTGIDNLSRISLMSDGYLLTMDSQNTSWEYANYNIKTDKQGNEIWRKQLQYYQSVIGLNNTIHHFRSATSCKSDHIIAHFVITNITDTSVTQNQVLIEFDENGNEIDYRKYEEKRGFPWGDIFVNEDAEIFILAQQELGPPLHSQLYAIKFNAEKEIVWEHHYGEENITEFYFCGMLTSDGGVLLGGRDQHFQLGAPYFNSIIVKTDCRGELEWSYENCVLPDLDEVVVFPNPFSEQFSIHLPNLPKESEIMVHISSITGHFVDQLTFFDTNTIQIETSHYADGLYNCTISVNGAVLTNRKIIKMIFSQ